MLKTKRLRAHHTSSSNSRLSASEGTAEQHNTMPRDNTRHLEPKKIKIRTTTSDRDDAAILSNTREMQKKTLNDVNATMRTHKHEDNKKTNTL